VIRVLFFARYREQLDCATLELPWAAELASLDSLEAQLVRQGGPAWQAVFAESNLVRAVNQTVVQPGATLADGDEVAFYPPVTGG
jgi:molybdopterin synthase sulfur carrier subunit